MSYLFNLVFIFVTQALGQSIKIHGEKEGHIPQYEGSPNKDFVDVSGFRNGCGTRFESLTNGAEISGGEQSHAGQFPWIVRIHG